MVNYVDNFSTDMNFWDLYPEFKITNPFKEIYKKDKSKGRGNSSTFMWFIALCYSKASKYRNLAKDGIDGKHYVIGEDFCGDKNYYSKYRDELDSAIEAFIKLQYSPLERHLMTWDDLLDKRTAFLKEQSYDFTNFDELDKMAVGTDKVFSTIKKIWEDISKEDTAGVGKGGAVASLND